jgi:hypothetical protein
VKTTHLPKVMGCSTRMALWPESCTDQKPRREMIRAGLRETTNPEMTNTYYNNPYISKATGKTELTKKT